MKKYKHIYLPYTLEVDGDNVTLTYVSYLKSGGTTPHSFDSISAAMNKLSLDFSDFREVA